jgi:hypothetical protein
MKKAQGKSSTAEHGRRNSFELEPRAGSSRRGSFSREDKMAAMAKSFSTGTLQGLLPEPTPESSYYEHAGEQRIRIEFEGDGPLGILFVEDEDGDIVVDDIQPGTACSEFKELETELLLREIDGVPCTSYTGAATFRSAMQAIGAAWRMESAVTLVFARPGPPTPTPSPPPRTASGPPTLAGMVRIKDDGVGSLYCMSPIHEAHRKGSTPRQTAGQMRAAPPPPELSLEGLSESPAAAPVETKQQLQLRQVREFLRELKVDEYLNAFIDFGVSSMEDMKFIEPPDLPGFGLKPLQQRRVAVALVALQQQDDDDDGLTDPTATVAAAPTIADHPRVAAAVRAGDGMARSPSQVFETDALEPPPLTLDADDDDDDDSSSSSAAAAAAVSPSSADINIFISPFLPPDVVEQEAARIQQKYKPSSRDSSSGDRAGAVKTSVHQLQAASAEWTSTGLSPRSPGSPVDV